MNVGLKVKKKHYILNATSTRWTKKTIYRTAIRLLAAFLPALIISFFAGFIGCKISIFYSLNSNFYRLFSIKKFYFSIAIRREKKEEKNNKKNRGKLFPVELIKNDRRIQSEFINSISENSILGEKSKS